MPVILWMSGALASFCLIAIGARELSSELPVYQTLFYRSVVGLLCISLVLGFIRKNTSIRTQRPSLHIARNIFHFGGQYGWFVGIGMLPLAEVFALEFTVPIWTLLIASIALNEQITPRKLASIAIGIIGVLIIVRPGYALINIGSLIVLATYRPMPTDKQPTLKPCNIID